MAHSSSQAKKATASGWIGSALEYYDFFIYAQAAALIFPQIFFPNTDPKMAIIASLATYGVGYLARPVGAFVLGHWGDTRGRKNVLLLCMFLMGLSTMAVGLLPTYHDIGYLAPALLVVLRLIQGFAVAGEISGASSMIMEHAPFGRRGYYASFTLQGVQAGQVLAAAVFLPLAYFMPSEAFTEWGWRIPFLMSAALVLIGLWIRKDIDETPEFKKVKSSGKVAKAPLRETLTHHWREVIIAAGLKVVETAPFYIFSTFVVSYATTTLTYQKSQVLEAVTLGALVSTVMIPLMGLLSDKIGRQRMYAISVVLLGLFIVPWFLLLNTGTTWGITLATVITFGILWSPITAVLGTLCSEIFSANVRYTGITLGYQIGAALAGGTAPLIATGLLAKYNGDWVPVAWYLATTVAISLTAIFFASRRKNPAASVNAQTSQI